MATSVDGLSKLDPSLTSLPANAAQEKKDEIGQTEFMQLLVTQLQHQDPLNPMENEEFAVQLAQFSQLEQLVGIKQTLEDGGAAGSGGGISSMAAYLGREVTLNSDSVEVKNNDGGEISFELAGQSAAVTVDLLNSSGQSVETINLGAMSAGRQSVKLSNLSTESGQYTAQVSALTSAGAVNRPDVSVSGIVSAFVPGPEPTLIVGNREVAPADILEVSVADTV